MRITVWYGLSCDSGHEEKGKYNLKEYKNKYKILILVSFNSTTKTQLSMYLTYQFHGWWNKSGYLGTKGTTDALKNRSNSFIHLSRLQHFIILMSDPNTQ